MNLCTLVILNLLNRDIVLYIQISVFSKMKVIMMEHFRTWHEILMERLSDPEDVINYLKVSLEHNKKLLVIDVKQVNTK